MNMSIPQIFWKEWNDTGKQKMMKASKFKANFYLVRNTRKEICVKFLFTSKYKTRLLNSFWRQHVKEILEQVVGATMWPGSLRPVAKLCCITETVDSLVFDSAAHPGLVDVIHVVQSAGAVEYTDYFSAEVKDSPSECPVYDTKQFDGEVPIMLELWRIRNTRLLLLLPGPLWPGVVAPDKFNRTKSWTYAELNCLK